MRIIAWQRFSSSSVCMEKPFPVLFTLTFDIRDGTSNLLSISDGDLAGSQWAPSPRLLLTSWRGRLERSGRHISAHHLSSSPLLGLPHLSLSYLSRANKKANICGPPQKPGPWSDGGRMWLIALAALLQCASAYDVDVKKLEGLAKARVEVQSQHKTHNRLGGGCREHRVSDRGHSPVIRSREVRGWVRFCWCSALGACVSAPPDKSPCCPYSMKGCAGIVNNFNKLNISSMGYLVKGNLDCDENHCGPPKWMNRVITICLFRTEVECRLQFAHVWDLCIYFVYAKCLDHTDIRSVSVSLCCTDANRYNSGWLVL